MNLKKLLRLTRNPLNLSLLLRSIAFQVEAALNPQSRCPWHAIDTNVYLQLLQIKRASKYLEDWSMLTSHNGHTESFANYSPASTNTVSFPKMWPPLKLSPTTLAIKCTGGGFTKLRHKVIITNQQPIDGGTQWTNQPARQSECGAFVTVWLASRGGSQSICKSGTCY